jgi:hypothetical protein
VVRFLLSMMEQIGEESVIEPLSLNVTWMKKNISLQ